MSDRKAKKIGKKRTGYIRMAWYTAFVNLRRWRRSPQVWLAFGLGFVICFLLSDKVLLFAHEHDTLLQILEPFIWTFGDSMSVMLVTLPLLLLFADMPNLGNEVPFLLVRMNRAVWLLGQILSMLMGTLAFVGFLLLSSCILAGGSAYPANMWSNTAAILGYSTIGEEIAVPAFVKVLELSFPYPCMLHIFGLMAGYSVMMTSLILCLNLWKGKAGMAGGIAYSCFGFLMNPEVIAGILGLPKERIREANILFGWISPLNHATYYMHNFGYDNLPRLWHSYLFFGIGSLLLFCIAIWRIRYYAFDFTGTQH